MHLDFNPLVSIVIPVYNGSDYLKEAIDSALSQTYKNIEVLVINDGSSDDGATEKIALNYGERIRYFNKENGGVASALNVGIQEMKGDYFSWLSHDDIYLPDKIETQLEKINQWKDKKLIPYGKSIFIDSGSKIIGKEKGYQETCSIEAVYFDRLNGCTMLIPKEVFSTVGFFNEALRTTQDYDLWFRMLKNKYNFKYIDAFFLKSRYHSAQGSRNISNAFLEKEDLLKKFILDADLDEIRKNFKRTHVFYFKYASYLIGKLLFKTATLSKLEGVKHFKQAKRNGLILYLFVVNIYIKAAFNILEYCMKLIFSYRRLRSMNMFNILMIKFKTSKKK